MHASIRLAGPVLGLVLAATGVSAADAPTMPALHDGLLALDTPGSAPLDAAGLKQLHELFARYAWPTVKNAGRDGVDAFGHLIERAGANERMQDEGEAHLNARIGIDVDAQAFAALSDRIEVAHQRAQQYGTLLALDGKRVVTSPAISASDANAYRDAIGLPFLAVYLKQVQAAIDTGESLAQATPAPRLSTELHPVSQPALRGELHQMAESDHVARSAYVLEGMKEGSAEQKRVAAVDASHLPRIKAIFAKFGFPDAAMVGRSGVADFLLLSQRAEQDKAFQLAVWQKAEAVMQKGDLSRQQYALLTDRVLLAQGKKQRYGSQLDDRGGHSVPLPLEDPAHVDQRRAAMGLEPLADYIKDSDALDAPAASTSSH